MNDDLERDLEALLHQQALDARPPEGAARRVVRRARVRRTVVPAVTVAALFVVGSGVVAGTRDLFRDDAPDVAASATPAVSSDNPGEYELGDDPSTEKKVEIATGERAGLEWTLSAYREGKSLCVDDQWGGGGGGGCGPRPNEHDINLGLSSGGEPEWMLNGELSYDVAAVEVRLEGQEPFRVPVLPDPADFGVNFFVAFIPPDSKGEVAVFDAGGRELEVASFTDLADFSWLDDEGSESGPNACLDTKPTILGTEGNDVIEGTPGDDVIRAFGGNDTIDGGGGNDFICGDDGDDVITSGAGDDEIEGGPGSDELDGGDGFDWLAYWNAADGVNVNLTEGTATGEGNDSVGGFEILGGSKHDDVLVGTEGDEQIEAIEGDDVIQGLGGDDTIYAGEGNDEVDGGAGRDFFGFDFEAESGAVVDLAAGTSSGQGEDVLRGIEIVHGTEFDDTLIGTDDVDYFSGREGNDTIMGAGGDDEIWGEYPRYTAAMHRKDGNYMEFSDDSIDGGPGYDTIGGGPGKNTCTNGEELKDC